MTAKPKGKTAKSRARRRTKIKIAIILQCFISSFSAWSQLLERRENRSKCPEWILRHFYTCSANLGKGGPYDEESRIVLIPTHFGITRKRNLRWNACSCRIGPWSYWKCDRKTLTVLATDLPPSLLAWSKWPVSWHGSCKELVVYSKICYCNFQGTV